MYNGMTSACFHCRRNLFPFPVTEVEGKLFCSQQHAHAYFDSIVYCSNCRHRERVSICDNDCGYGTCTQCGFDSQHACASSSEE